MIVPRLRFYGDPALCAAWVGPAKKWARDCYVQRILTKVYRPAEGVEIRVENQFPPRVSTVGGKGWGSSTVWINAESTGWIYQFFGSEKTLYKTYLDPNRSGRYLPLGHWVQVKAKLKDAAVELTAKPLLSNLRASVDRRWPYNPNPYWAKTVEDRSPLTISPAHQPDGVGVKVWRNIRENGAQTPWLATPWAEPTPFYEATRLGGSSPVPSIPQLTDFNYDIAPTVFSRLKGSPQVPETDWYRGAALRKVTHATYGSRSFIIMVDTTHTFWCYPTGVRGEYLSPDPGDKANVEAKYAKSQVAPFPAWVTTFAVGKNSPLSPSELETAIQPCWVFSPQGDKAAIIAFHRDDAWADDYYTSSRLNPTNGSLIWHLQEDWPGLVEVAFSVSITGENHEDFSFAVTLKQASCSINDGRGYLAVGYCALDQDSLPNTPRHNELVVLEHEYYLDTNKWLRPASDYAAEGIPVNDTSWHVLSHPPLAAVAKVSVEGRSVLGWLSSYLAIWEGNDKFDANDLFSPMLADLSDAPAVEIGLQTVSWQTQINAMDLSTLSFVLGATLTLTAQAPGGSKLLPPSYVILMQWPAVYCASSAVVAVYAWGQRHEQKAVGHIELQSVVAQALSETLALDKDGFPALINDLPDLSSFTPIDLRATIDSESIHPTQYSPSYYDLWNVPNYATWQFEGSQYEPLTQQQFSTLTLNPGDSKVEPITENILFALAFAYWNHASPDGELNLWFSYYLSMLAYSSRFSEHWVIMTPRVFLMFDNFDYLRPGIRWVKTNAGYPPHYRGYETGTLILEDGETSFSGYPVGILVHNRFSTSALNALNCPYATLATHPNGSYAAFVGPFAAYTKIIEAHPNITSPKAWLDPDIVNSIQQDVLDIIRVKLVKDNKYVEKSTTHLEQLNSAFNLSLAPDDYIYQSSVRLGKLILQLPTYAPNLLNTWNAHGINEVDRQDFNGQVYGESSLLSPFALGWMKHCYVKINDGYIVDTVPTFSQISLITCEIPCWTAMPTPKMESLFSPLPLVKKTV